MRINTIDESVLRNKRNFYFFAVVLKMRLLAHLKTVNGAHEDVGPRKITMNNKAAV